MANVLDVAAYILKECGEMTAMKLQKLVYYSQAWALVWDSKPLFNERIEAWANGPVAPDLYNHHRGQFMLGTDSIAGDPNKLEARAKDTIDAVLKFYGDKDARWLSELTHQERPWRDARLGIPEGERGSAEITPAAMCEYYDSL
ncbi:type II toxin-antitoxin system antitoxin SocA domain-containing protein [Thalassospira sp.]|uniref:Panacea domain-containing protein n=1 Tax=Thalassospira sp. TaxID=1912094 RepID=UPI00311E2AE9